MVLTSRAAVVEGVVKGRHHDQHGSMLVARYVVSNKASSRCMVQFFVFDGTVVIIHHVPDERGHNGLAARILDSIN